METLRKLTKDKATYRFISSLMRDREVTYDKVKEIFSLSWEEVEDLARFFNLD